MDPIIHSQLIENSQENSIRQINRSPINNVEQNGILNWLSSQHSNSSSTKQDAQFISVKTVLNSFVEDEDRNQQKRGKKQKNKKRNFEQNLDYNSENQAVNIQKGKRYNNTHSRFHKNKDELNQFAQNKKISEKSEKSCQSQKQFRPNKEIDKLQQNQNKKQKNENIKEEQKNDQHQQNDKIEINIYQNLRENTFNFNLGKDSEEKVKQREEEIYQIFQHNKNSTEDTESPIIQNNLQIQNANTMQTLSARFNIPFNHAASYSSIIQKPSSFNSNLHSLFIASDVISSCQPLLGQNCLQDQVKIQNSIYKPQYRFEFINVENIQSEIQSDFDENEVIRNFRAILDNSQDQNIHPQGIKIQEKFVCDQQIFRRIKRDGIIQLYWVIHNVGNSDFFNRKNDPNYIKHYIESELFESSDGMIWKLRLQPGEISNPPLERPSQSSICLAAFPNHFEKQTGKYKREFEATFQALNFNCKDNFFSTKDCKKKFYVYNGIEDAIQCSTMKFYQFLIPNEMEKNGLFKQIVIKIDIENIVDTNNDFRGLVNEGMTCYLNSLLQTMFFIKAFRNAIFQIPTINESQDEKDNNQKGMQIVKCLQRIFFQLEQAEDKPVRTQQLLKAFGWNNNEQNNQQDVNEFNCILSDLLEKQMEKTNLKGTYSSLFEGVLENVVQCTDILFTSAREEKFSTIQLNVKENKTIQDCFKEYISVETLEGLNKYETLDNGKQNAKKFIRFKKLPPVLQISLNRYEFDPAENRMVKNNQSLQFQDILELGVILKNAKNQDSNLQKEENRYHLHSILIHRGTLNSGHYYSFIRPNIDEKWYEFNDNKVQEVQKSYAFSQGIGGIDTNFDVLKLSGKDYKLIETFEQSNINAYMLIYIREDEREQIMMDQIQPQNKNQLLHKFSIEQLFIKTIYYDIKKLDKHKTVYLLSDQILNKQIWNGANICNHQDFFQKEEFGNIFENDVHQRMKIIVDDRITINQFIIMIKDKYFSACENVSHEDIWIYRIEFMGAKNKVVGQTFEKHEFNIEKNYKTPLFSNGNGESKLGKGKSKQTKNQKKKYYIFIAINPNKLDSANYQPYQIFQMLDQSEIDNQKDHFMKFQENPNFNNIISENNWELEYCQQIYNSYACNLYKFKNQSQIQEIQMNDNGQIVENNDINDFDNQIKEYRSVFTFLYEPQYLQIEENLHEISQLYINNQIDQDLNLQSQNEQESQSENQKLKEILIILKVADLKNNKIYYQETIFQNRMDPLNLNEIAAAYKIQLEYLLNMNYYLFLEPSSNQSIKSSILQYLSKNQYNESKQIFPLSYVLDFYEFGFNCKYSEKHFLINLQVDKFIAPLNDFLEKNKDGITLILCRPDDQDLQNQIERFDGIPDKLLNLDHYYKSFEVLYDFLIKQIYVDAYVSQIESIHSTERQYVYVDSILLNYNHSYQNLCQKLYEACKSNDYEIQSHQHLKFFKSDEQYFVSFKETVNQEYANNFLSKIIDKNDIISFIILDKNLQEDNDQPDINFLYFKSLSMKNYEDKPYFKQNLYRQFSLKDLYNKFKNEQNYEIDNSNTSVNVLPLLLDRKSQIIIKVLSLENKFEYIVRDQNDARIPFLIRFQDLTQKEEKKVLKETKNERLVGCVQIFDQFRKKQFQQFIVILTCNIDTFDKVYINIKEKLSQIIANEDNPISKMVTNLDNMKLLVVDYIKEKNQKIVNFKKFRIYAQVNMQDDNISDSFQEDNTFHKSEKVSILIDSAQRYYQDYNKEIYSEQEDMQFLNLQPKFKHIYLGVQIQMEVNGQNTDLVSINKDVSKSKGFFINTSDDS